MAYSSSSFSSAGPAGPDSDLSVNSTSTQGATRSLLDKLRTPKASKLTRKRKLHANCSVGERRRHLPGGSLSDPKSVTPSQRVREFRTEQLTVSAGKLFCTACRKEMVIN